MKLVFYGGGDDEDNCDLDRILLEMSGTARPLITYIPSCSYESEDYFRDFVKQYEKFRVKRILNFPIDINIEPILMREVFKSDIIHLSGGNTFYFLHCLRKAKLLGELKKFVRRGGILTGLSAGGILMTPNIETAAFPSFDRDDNEDNLKNLNSLGLVKFFFFPHYRNSKRYDDELIRYSRTANLPVYAVPDGAGIIVNGEDLIFHKKVYCFYKNQKIQMR